MMNFTQFGNVGIKRDTDVAVCPVIRVGFGGFGECVDTMGEFTVIGR